MKQRYEKWNDGEKKKGRREKKKKNSLCVCFARENRGQTHKLPKKDDLNMSS